MSPQFCLPPHWCDPSITGLPQCAGTCQSQKGPQPQTDVKALAALGPPRDRHAADALSGSAGVRKPFLPISPRRTAMALCDGLPSPRCLLAPECSATLGQGGLFPSSSLPGSGSCSVDRRCLSGVSSFLSFVCCPDPAQPRVGQQRITQSARVLPPGKLDREGGGRQDAAVRPQPLQRERDAWGQAAGQAGGETAWPSGSPPPPRGHTPPLCTGPFVCKDVNASPAGWATPGVQCLSRFSGGKGLWGGGSQGLILPR